MVTNSLQIKRVIKIIVFSFLRQVTVKVLRSTAKATTVRFGVLQLILPMLGPCTSTVQTTSPQIVKTYVAQVYLSVAYLNDFIMFLSNTIKTTKPEGKMSSGHFYSILEWKVIVVIIC